MAIAGSYLLWSELLLLHNGSVLLLLVFCLVDDNGVIAVLSEEVVCELCSGLVQVRNLAVRQLVLKFILDFCDVRRLIVDLIILEDQNHKSRTQGKGSRQATE